MKYRYITGEDVGIELRAAVVTFLLQVKSFLSFISRLAFLVGKELIIVIVKLFAVFLNSLK